MISWTRADRLAVVLVALAGINVGILDQVGHGLVADVEGKYSSLGADWLVMRYEYRNETQQVDREAILARLRALEGVQDLMWAVSSNQFLAEPIPPDPSQTYAFRQIRSTEFLLLGPGYDPVKHPYIYTLFQDQSEGTSFYRTEVIWAAGRAPSAPLEVAVPIRFAAERGLALGDPFMVEWNGGMFASPGAVNRTFTVVGLYEPISTGNMGEDGDRVLVGADAALVANITQVNPMNPARLLVFLRTDMDATGSVVAGAQQVLEDMGLTFAVQESITDIVRVTGGGDVVIRTTTGFSNATNEPTNSSMEPTTSPTSGPSTGPTPSPTPTNGTTYADAGGSGPVIAAVPTASWGFGNVERADVDMYANTDLLRSAFDAAQRAGLWFRFLGIGSVLLAGIGIGFIVRAGARRMALDVGIRQAVGFTGDRIVGRWVLHAIGIAMVGSALALAIVLVPMLLGLGTRLVGVELVMDVSTWIVVPALALTIYVAAGAPMVARFARRPPCVNLREVDTR